MDCNTVRELLAEYALDLVDAEEKARIDAHLHDCAACRTLLAEYLHVVESLPHALAVASPYQPPLALKVRLLQQVTPTIALQPAAPALPASLPLPRGVAPEGTHLGRRRWPLRLAAIAAAVLFVLTLAWSIRLSVALARERALRAEFVDLVGQQQELVLEVVDSNETVRRVLRPPAGDSRAYGKLFTRANLTHVVAMAARLPAPPPGEAYHLWLTRNGKTELAGLLTTNSDGFGLLIYEAESPAPAYEAAAVTLQPAGAAAPAGESILVWRAGD